MKNKKLLNGRYWFRCDKDLLKKVRDHAKKNSLDLPDYFREVLEKLNNAQVNKTKGQGIKSLIKQND